MVQDNNKSVSPPVTVCAMCFTCEVAAGRLDCAGRLNCANDADGALPLGVAEALDAARSAHRDVESAIMDTL